jgi:putative SOS response-associated peptidase YedK
VPSYAKDLKGPPMFNARAETIATKAPFKNLVGKPRNRCLIVADGFYEWLRPEDKKAPRVPFRFTVDDGAPYAFAGLWNWTKLDGEWLASCTIITTQPNEKVARLHDRMPVILPGPEEEAAWLSSDLEPDDAVGLCVPLDADRMSVTPANPRVNKSGLEDEGPDLLTAP